MVDKCSSESRRRHSWRLVFHTPFKTLRRYFVSTRTIICCIFPCSLFGCHTGLSRSLPSCMCLTTTSTPQAREGAARNFTRNSQSSFLAHKLPARSFMISLVHLGLPDKVFLPFDAAGSFIIVKELSLSYFTSEKSQKFNIHASRILLCGAPSASLCFSVKLSNC